MGHDSSQKVNRQCRVITCSVDDGRRARLARPVYVSARNAHPRPAKGPMGDPGAELSGDRGLVVSSSRALMGVGGDASGDGAPRRGGSRERGGHLRADLKGVY